MENEEVKDVKITDPKQPEPADTPPAEESTKSFTQDDVNRIVQERLARERERINSMINEDEGIRKELTESRLKLTATKELNAAGYPVEIVDMVDCTDEKACKESIARVKKVYDLAYKKAVDDIYKGNGRTPSKGNDVARSIDNRLRSAFLQKE